MKSSVCGLTMLLLFTLAPVSRGNADSGTWVKQGEFAQINVFCQRLYTCQPTEDIVYSSESKLVVTPPETVRGVCYAGAGAVDSCNQCLTNPPNAVCEWHLEEK